MLQATFHQHNPVGHIVPSTCRLIHKGVCIGSSSSFSQQLRTSTMRQQRAKKHVQLNPHKALQCASSSIKRVVWVGGHNQVGTRPYQLDRHQGNPTPREEGGKSKAYYTKRMRLRKRQRKPGQAQKVLVQGMQTSTACTW